MTITLQTASAALVAAATGMDRAAARSEPAKQAWALYCATNMLAKSLTMEQVTEAIIAAAKEAAGVRRGAKLNSLTDVSKGYSSTLAGWVYDLRRVEKAGLLKLIVDGQSLTTIRRGTDPTQPKVTSRKGGDSKSLSNNDNKPSPTVVVTPPSSFSEACAAFIAASKRAKVAAIANSHQAELALVIQTATALARQVEAHIAAKAARQPRQRKAA